MTEPAKQFPRVTSNSDFATLLKRLEGLKVSVHFAKDCRVAGTVARCAKDFLHLEREGMHVVVPLSSIAYVQHGEIQSSLPAAPWSIDLQQ